MPTAALPENRGPGLSATWCRLWAGLQCGVGGGVLILGWFILHSLLRKEYWWSRFNVAGGLFYGPEVYHSGLGRATLSGAAVLLLYYCLAGMVFGWLADPASRLRTLLRAALSAGLLHAFASFCLWPAMGLFAPLWFAWKTTLPADLILLLALARFPIYYSRLADYHGAATGPLASAIQPIESQPQTPATDPSIPDPTAENGSRS
jgi:hypothetical protein